MLKIKSYFEISEILTANLDLYTKKEPVKVLFSSYHN